MLRTRFLGLLLFVVLIACAEKSPRAHGGGLEPPEGSGSSAPPGEDGGTNAFVSSDPRLPQGYDWGGGSVQDAGSSGDGDGDGDGAGDLASVLAEADIVQIKDDRLYALSKRGTLTVVDAHDPSALRELGQYVFAGQPFEMYLRDGVVLALVDTTAGPDFDARSLTDVIALDVTDSAAMRVRSEIRLGGRTVDSRLRGDVLYLVLNDYFSDADGPGHVQSIAVGDPDALASIDVAISSRDVSYSSTAHFSESRIYVASHIWDEAGTRSLLTAIDMSDAAGALEISAELEVEGYVNNRWQLDEHEGVLRVIAQVDSSEPPVVQTFRIEADGTAPRLGRLEMVLPRPEELRSVRFDGTRAYAITFQRTDPLFTLDLSDPAAPAQMGELEIPGWVRHMEPRGDRLIGLGHESDEGDGMNVSLFDVSDLSNPTMIQRVTFAGDNYESADRIHKAFRVLDDEGLILVPYVWGDVDMATDCNRQSSGVQLVEFTHDTLTLRGAAGASASAERALLHRDHLIAVGDDAIQAFDIGDRDAPQLASSLRLIRDVQEVAIAGEHLVRIVDRDYDRRGGRLDVVERDQPNPRAVLSELDLDALGGEALECRDATFSIQLRTNDRYAFLLRTNEGHENETARASLTVIDLADPESAEIVWSEDLAEVETQQRIGSVQLVGDALVVQGLRRVVRDDIAEITGVVLHVIDVSVPEAPAVHTLDLGDASGASTLSVVGDDVYLTLSERAGERLQTNTLVRVDVGDPSEPVIAQRNAVLGSLLAMIDARSALTQSYTLKVEERVLYDDCPYQGSWIFDGLLDYSSSRGRCEWLESTVHVMTIPSNDAQSEPADSLAIDVHEIAAVSVDEGRAAIALAHFSNRDQGGKLDDILLATPSAEQGAVFAPVRVPESINGVLDLFLTGDRAIATTYEGIYRLDLSDLEAVTSEPILEDGFSSAWSGLQNGDELIVTRGSMGVEVIDLEN